MPKLWSLPVFTGLKNLYQFSQWSNAKTNINVQEFPSEDRKKLYVTWFALKSLDVRFWPCAGVDAIRIFILKGARHRMKVSHSKRIYVLWFPLFCSHHHTLAYTKNTTDMLDQKHVLFPFRQGIMCRYTSRTTPTSQSASWRSPLSQASWLVAKTMKSQASATRRAWERSSKTWIELKTAGEFPQLRA